MMIHTFFQIERKHIVAVQFIIEGYDGMATVSTMDAQKAILRISIMPDFLPAMNGLIDELQRQYGLKEISDDRET